MVDREPIDVAADALEPYRDAIGTFSIDVTDAEALRGLHTTLNDRWGTLHVLVNNAGISFKQSNGRASTLATMSDEEWDSVLAVNLTAVMRLCRMFLPDMQAAGAGRIINVASLAGRTRSRVAGPAYVASKTAVIGLTRAIAGEYGRFGITANCVAPGRIISAMSGPSDTEVNQAYLTQIPSARFGTVDEVAAAIGYLASDDAGFVNGAVIDINGGAHMA
jgi:3-oxoacyl-[acyl-carrier protein] reductase